MFLIPAPLVGQTSVAVGTATTSVRPAATRRITIDADRIPLWKALDMIAASSQTTVQYRSDVIEQYTVPVTVHVVDMPVALVFERVVAGTPFRVVTLDNGRFGVERVVTEGRAAGGIITGHVRDAKTGRPIRGVTVSLDGAGKGAMTGDDGKFRLSGVAPGTHTIHLRIIGYVRATKPTTVEEGQTTTVDATLEASVNTLDQVVVTGTVIPTELRAVPNAITVITAKDLEQRGITHIDQLFRGDVPGVVALNRGATDHLGEVTMYSRGATAIDDNYSKTDQATNPIKTYVDGIEMADSKYLSQIDPRSIERIEILTGPQASTIYGSNAINGVMQIFTKRGSTSRPQLTLDLQNGWAQSNYSNTLTPMHSYSANATGTEGRLSYNVGSSWDYTGRWTPEMQSARMGGYGGARFDVPTPVGRVTTDVSARRSRTVSKVFGNSQTSSALQNSGVWNNYGSGGISPYTYALSGQTTALTVSYVPMSWWSHEVKIGDDVDNTQQQLRSSRHSTPADSGVQLYNRENTRRSVIYGTTARAPLTSHAQMVLSAGADYWQNLQQNWTLFTGTSLQGSFPSENVLSFSRNPYHNTGAYLNGQFTVFGLSLTSGVRAEWNPTLGSAEQGHLQPTSGMAYVHEMGNVTVKLRGAYGRSKRPPPPGYANGILIDAVAYADPFYHSFPLFYVQLPNPDLGPETQQGADGGLELYLGNRVTFQVTRYNQTVSNLIVGVKADSVRSLVPNPGGVCTSNPTLCTSDGHFYLGEGKLVNAANIRNQGWELQGSVTTGPFTTRGTYSWTKSRVLAATTQWRNTFAIRSDPRYTPGATFNLLPEHTWATNVTYVSAGTSLTLAVNGIGQANNNRDPYALQYLQVGRMRLPVQESANMDGTAYYVSMHPSYMMATLTGSQRLTPRVDAVLNIQNLTDYYVNDFDAVSGVLGRQSTLGFRVRF